METDLIQDGGQVKRQTDIDHHGPKYILIICHLPDPPTFSLPTTFNEQKLYTFSMRYVAGKNIRCSYQNVLFCARTFCTVHKQNVLFYIFLTKK
jgi:hypothetical protein